MKPCAGRHRSAFTNHLGRDALPNLAFGVPVGEQREVGVRVGVDETREHGLYAEIHLSNAGCGEIQDIGVFSNGKEPAARNSHRFLGWLGRIHRHHMAVVEDQVRLFLFEREKREGGKRAEKLAASRAIGHSASVSATQD